MIESLGVPHTEVELVLVNGESVGFGHRLHDGDRVAVYPTFEAFDVTPLLRVREWPLRVTRFVADVHLGGLAYLLRMAGFDTLYDNHFDDGEIAAISAREGRIVLTRDRELLMRRAVTHGCYVHALKSEPQFREIFGRLDLGRSARPFTLCPYCNVLLDPADKAEIETRLPATVSRSYQRFATCADCQRVFWEGDHWERLAELMAESGPDQASANSSVSP